MVLTICRDFNEWQQDFQINRLPTVLTVLPVILIYTALWYYMEYYILTTNHSISLFAMGCYLTWTSYYTLDHFLVKCSVSYKTLLKQDRYYVISNLIKSGLLFVYTPLALYSIWEICPSIKWGRGATFPAALWNYAIIPVRNWPVNRLHNLGCLYCIPDTVSLVMVRKMKLNTQLHHICVLIFWYVNLRNDFQQSNVWTSVVVYAIFSTFAYAVNFLLASRFLNFGQGWMRLLTLISLDIYLICCLLNWSFQIYYLAFLWKLGQRLSVTGYSALMCLLVYDDILLIKWLCYKYKGGRRKRN